jgi:hypothetical protein
MNGLGVGGGQKLIHQSFCPAPALEHAVGKTFLFRHKRGSVLTWNDFLLGDKKSVSLWFPADGCFSEKKTGHRPKAAKSPAKLSCKMRQLVCSRWIYSVKLPWLWMTTGELPVKNPTPMPTTPMTKHKRAAPLIMRHALFILCHLPF